MPPAGWYPDPADPKQERYWAGESWTHNVRPWAGAMPPPTAEPAETETLATGGSTAARGFTDNDEAPSEQPSQPGTANPSGAATFTPGGATAAQPQQGYGQAPYGQPDYGQGYGTPVQGSAPMGGYQGYPTQPGYPYAAYDRHIGPTTVDGVPLAGWWWRVLATLLDGLLLNIIVGFVTTSFAGALTEGLILWANDVERVANAGGGQIPSPLDPAYGLVGPYLTIIVITLAISLTYATAMLVYKGATLGQLAVGLRVVPDGLGQQYGRLGLSMALIRNIAYQLIGIVPILGLVNYLMPLFNAKRQTFHDMIAKTQVVKIN